MTENSDDTGSVDGREPIDVVEASLAPGQPDPQVRADDPPILRHPGAAPGSDPDRAAMRPPLSDPNLTGPTGQSVGVGATSPWPHRALVFAWTVPPLILVLAIMGFFPGLSPVALAWLLGAGNIECTANQGWDALTAWCPQVGAPLGSPLLSGLPETYFGAAVTHLPGIDAWDAYRLMSVVCVIAGFAGAFALLRRWGAPVWVGALAAYLYLSSPTVLLLNGYTFSFHGYVLLPAGLWLTLKSFDLFEADRRWFGALVAFGTAWLLVFTDGYSFVGGGVAILGLGTAWLIGRGAAPRQKLWGAGSWFAAVLSAVIAYLAYIPTGGTHPAVGLGTFRFYGLDAITLFVPSPVSAWAADLPWNRTLQRLWGTSDNQLGNYLGVVAIALVIVAILLGAFRRSARRGRELLAMAVIGVVALILAFGPALKVANFANDTVQGENVPVSQTRLWLPTSWLYEYIPGFMDMRATYRTFTVTRLVVVVLACVGLVMLWRSRRFRLLAPVFAVLLIIDSSMSIPKQLDLAKGAHAHVDLVRTQFQPNLEAMMGPGDLALILPAGNDFLATAIVPFTRGTSYNVGVDKNLELSREQWPASVRAAVATYGTPQFTDAACALLKTDATVVVLSYISLFQGGITSAIGPVVVPDLVKRAQGVAASGRFTVSDTPTGLTLRRGPGC